MRAHEMQVWTVTQVLEKPETRGDAHADHAKEIKKLGKDGRHGRTPYVDWTTLRNSTRMVLKATVYASYSLLNACRFKIWLMKGQKFFVGFARGALESDLRFVSKDHAKVQLIVFLNMILIKRLLTKMRTWLVTPVSFDYL